MILSGLIFAKGQKEAFQYIIIFGFLEKFHLNFFSDAGRWALTLRIDKKAT